MLTWEPAATKRAYIP